MNSLIKQQAQSLGYEITDWDVEEIKDKYFYNLHRNGQPWIQGIRSAIRSYFA